MAYRSTQDRMAGEDVLTAGHGKDDLEFTSAQVQQMDHTNFFGPQRHHLAPLFEAILAGLLLDQPKSPRRYIYRCLLQIRAMRAKGLRNSDIRFDTFIGKNHPTKWPTHVLLTQGQEAHELLLQKLAREEEERERVVRALLTGLGRATASGGRERQRELERRALEGDSGTEGNAGRQRPSFSRESTNLGPGALVESLATPATSSPFYLTQQTPQNSFG